MNLDVIVKKIFNRCKNGLVSTSSSFHPGFYVKIDGVCNYKDDKYPVVEINNYNHFLLALEEYLKVAKIFYDDDRELEGYSEEEFIMQLIIGLVINAGREDLRDFNSYIVKRTNSFVKPMLDENIIKYGDYNIVCTIRNNSSFLEAPYKFLIVIRDKDFKHRFVLPTVNFYISDNKAYVFSLQRVSKRDIIGELEKKLDRYFRKVNKGVDINDDISNVSSNALVAFTIFCSYLKSIGIKEVVALNYMPLRYSFHYEIAELENNYDKKIEKIKSIDRDQFNITNKFMNVMNRYNYHFYSKDSYYDDLKDEMHVFLNGEKNNDGNIINEIDLLFNKENKKTHCK